MKKQLNVTNRSLVLIANESTSDYESVFDIGIFLLIDISDDCDTPDISFDPRLPSVWYQRSSFP